MTWIHFFPPPGDGGRYWSNPMHEDDTKYDGLYRLTTDAQHLTDQVVKSRTVPRSMINFVVAAMALSAAALVFLYYAFVSAPPAPEWSGPLGKWVAIGFERRRLWDLDSMNVFSAVEFAAEEKLLLASEAEILSSFPRDRAEFEAEHHQQFKDARRSAEATLWVALAVWIVASFTTFSGAVLMWRHDRRVALAAERKLEQCLT